VSTHFPPRCQTFDTFHSFALIIFQEASFIIITFKQPLSYQRLISDLYQLSLQLILSSTNSNEQILLKMTTSTEMTEISPLTMPLKTFDISSFARSSSNHVVGLKPSPRSQLCYTGSTSTPTFVDEVSFEEDEGFFLLSPEDLTESGDFTIGAPASSPSVSRRLLPRRLVDDWNSVQVVRQDSPMVIDGAPAPSLKRPRTGSFVLAKRSRPFDSNFLRDFTGADYYPPVDTAQQSQPTESQFCYEHMPVCIPLTPTSPDRCSSFLPARSPPSLHHDYSEEIQFCGGVNADLLLPILS
jgi:hypothetical protein